MKRPMTVADILNSVEFELIQHTLMQDDVADGIQRLRAYQANARTELLSDGKSPSVSSAIDAQFNTNEMLLTLVQVMNHRVEALQQDFRRAAFLKQHTLAAASDTAQFDTAQFDTAQSDTAQSNTAQSATDQSALSWLDVSESLPVSHKSIALEAGDLDEYALSATMIEEYVSGEPALLEMDVRESHTPLFGGLVNRTRRTLHELVLFYVNKAARQQSEVNHVYGKLLQELVAANQAQAQEIQELRGRLRQLTEQPPNITPQPDSGRASEQ